MIILSILLYYASQYTIHASPISAVPLPIPIDARDFPSTSIADGVPCSCPQLRSTWDILWSCLATIFACTWVSVHPNSPGPQDGRMRIIITRVELMIWAMLIPEMIICWAFKQWVGARQLAARFEEFGWSNVHGHFLQMGGFMLVDGDKDMGVIDPPAFYDLLHEGKIRFPRVSEDEINALSKGDGFSKLIVVGQTSWFIAQCISRAVQGLVITELELVTVAFAFLNGLMYFLWWNKPLDSSFIVRVPICSDLVSIPLPPSDDHDFTAVGNQPVAHIRKRLTTFRFSHLCNLWYLLYGIARRIIRRVDHMNRGGVHTFYAFASPLQTRIIPNLFQTVTIACIGAVFGAIHCAGWNFMFPSRAEMLIWRISSAFIFAYPTIVGLIVLILIGCIKAFFGSPGGSVQKMKGISMTNAMLYYVVPNLWKCLPFYLLARIMLLIEAFIALRGRFRAGRMDTCYPNANMIIISILLYYASQSTIHASPIASVSLPIPIDVRDFPSASITDDAPCSCTQLRSTWDILWSCLATIFACTWVSVHPNSPGPQDGRMHIILTRVKLMIWAMLIPEMIICWAFRQWVGARHLAGTFKEFGWSNVHGHFLQMGGFMLVDGDKDMGVIDPPRFYNLLQAGKIRIPRVSEDEINALSKGDGLSKLIVVGQTSWFTAQCISRAVQGLVITELELVTVAFAFLNVLMYFLWWNKPLDSSFIVRVPICNDLIPIRLPPLGGHNNDFTTITSLYTRQFITQSSVHPQNHTPRRSDASVDMHEAGPSLDGLNLYSISQDRSSNASVIHQNHVSKKSDASADKGTADSSLDDLDPHSTPQDRSSNKDRVTEQFKREGSHHSVDNHDSETGRSSMIGYEPSIDLGHGRCSSPNDASPAAVGNQPAVHIRKSRTTFRFPRLCRLWYLLYGLARYIIRRIDHMNRGVRTFYAFASPSQTKIIPKLFQIVTIACIGAVFGAIHCAGWNFMFPSRAEMLIWRISSAFIFAYPSIVGLIVLIIIGCFKALYRFPGDSLRNKKLRSMTIAIDSFIVDNLFKCLPIYLLVRIMLLVEAFIALRDLPQGAFVQVQWTRFLPHI
ncbi:hypothetical protein CVT25_006256 [Psilocybe cyanescens]|uniref:Uncharacterized protein n=1 Tax=Psilocybe cyanescens TaxID=93625 RepID=A0A409WYR9_PSICY|nr:hypothetical protein CVT25_006256 [Psilocybe cyanescens]